jgi:hypothetical protein
MWPARAWKACTSKSCPPTTTSLRGTHSSKQWSRTRPYSITAAAGDSAAQVLCRKEHWERPCPRRCSCTCPQHLLSMPSVSEPPVLANRGGAIDGQEGRRDVGGGAQIVSSVYVVLSTMEAASISHSEPALDMRKMTKHNALTIYQSF